MNEQVRGPIEVPPELKARLEKLVAEFEREARGEIETEVWYAWDQAADKLREVLEGRA